jgi:hypothetical protein
MKGSSQADSEQGLERSNSIAHDIDVWRAVAVREAIPRDGGRGHINHTKATVNKARSISNPRLCLFGREGR